MNGRMEENLKKEESVRRFLKKLPPSVSGWNERMKAENRTVDTRAAYLKKVFAFLSFVSGGAPREMDLSTLSSNDIVRFMNEIKTKTVKGRRGETIVNTSDSYQDCYWYCINSFCRYLYSAGITETNLMRDKSGEPIIGKVKNHDLQRVNEHRVRLSGEDFQKILEACETYGEETGKQDQAIRDKCILLMLMTTGMRRTALTEIDITDIKPFENTISVTDKGEKRHIYYMNEELCMALLSYLPIREKVLMKQGKKTDALFISNRGERISGERVARLVKMYTYQATGKALSPHKLRSGFCSIMYEKTKDIEFVRRAVGHSSINTTQRYIVTDREEKKRSAEIIGDLFESGWKG